MILFILLFVVEFCEATMYYDYYDEQYDENFDNMIPNSNFVKLPLLGAQKNPGFQQYRAKKLSLSQAKHGEPTTIITQPTTTRKPRRTYYPSLMNMDISATEVPNDKYKWIGLVVHSRTSDYPQVATAVCLTKNVFVTTERALETLRIQYTTVKYQGASLNAKYFAFSNMIHSFQLHAQAAAIITDNGNFDGEWVFKQYFPDLDPELEYLWLDKLKGEFKVVGFTISKNNPKIYQQDAELRLTELPVIVDRGICEKIYSHGYLTGLSIPCYFSCSFEEFKNNDTKCFRYHGASGAAVIQTGEEGYLVGIATWGVPFNNQPLPVGITTLNTNQYDEINVCAREIAAHGVNGDFDTACPP